MVHTRGRFLHPPPPQTRRQGDWRGGAKHRPSTPQSPKRRSVLGIGGGVRSKGNDTPTPAAPLAQPRLKATVAREPSLDNAVLTRSPLLTTNTALRGTAVGWSPCSNTAGPAQWGGHRAAALLARALSQCSACADVRPHQLRQRIWRTQTHRMSQCLQEARRVRASLIKRAQECRTLGRHARPQVECRELTAAGARGCGIFCTSDVLPATQTFRQTRGQ